MKTKLRICLLLLMATLSFVGCVTNDVVYEPTVVINDETRAQIEGMGFKTDNIVVTDDTYIVEGDIMISKKRLEELKNEPRTRHNYYIDYGHIISQYWLANNHNTVTVGIAYDRWAPSPEKDAMKRYYDLLNGVIEDFNHVNNFLIKLERLDSPSADIYISYGIAIPMNSNRFLVADIPMNEGPGSDIYINSRSGIGWANKNVFPDDRIRGSLTHAIGHCLGLGHTGVHEGNGNNSIGEDRYASNQRPLSGEHDDSGSIMAHSQTYITGSANINGILSSGDKAALAILYPAFSGGTIGFINGETVTTTTTIPIGATVPVFYSIKDAAGGSNVISCQWQQSANNSIWINIPGATSGRYYYHASSVLCETTYFRRRAISGSETKYSNVLTVIVTPNPGSIAENHTIWRNTVPALLTSTIDAIGVGNSDVTYQWQMCEANSDWTNVPSDGTSSSYQAPILTKSTAYRRVATSGNQTANSNTVFITVTNPAVTGPDNLRTNTSATYSTLTTLPQGVTFTGWTIPGKSTGVDYLVTGEINSPKLIIEFINPGQYDIEANFILPDNMNDSTIKTVNVLPAPLIFFNQVVSGNTTFISMYEIGASYVTVRYGALLTLYAPVITINEPFTVETGGSLVLTN